MKKLFTPVLFLVLIFSVVNSAEAQSGQPVVRLGIGVDAGSTFGNHSDPSRFLLGGDIRLQVPFGSGVSGILTTGYNRIFEKNYYSAYGIIPAKAGVKSFIAKNFYVAAEVGAAFAAPGRDVSFLSSGSLGYAFVKGLDISVKYEGYTRFLNDASHLALRLAYGFPLR